MPVNEFIPSWVLERIDVIHGRELVCYGAQVRSQYGVPVRAGRDAFTNHVANLPVSSYALACGCETASLFAAITSQ